ncbi:MAG: exodeoxyribonuclease V subunit gamma [Jiangellaceae bacterium]|nr:exodeoxyribonuclease V subunit gamma [Jiangellaceae bacterium]
MLHVHRSERADRLVDGLAEVLREPPADPFTPEIVAVPAKGVERWITQRLSHVLGTSPDGSDGVCANVRFPHPSALVTEVLGRAVGVDPADDPWHPDRLVWLLLETIDECALQEWCTTLGRHLGIGDAALAHRTGRRLATARHLAAVYDSYAAHRPSMLQAWAAYRDADVPEDLRWQAELFRRVRTLVDVPSPAERLAPACERLRTAPDLVDLPHRLSLFGPTRLTTAQLDVVAALAEHRAVHLWIPHPSPVLWDRVAPHADPIATPQRRDDPTVDVPRNELLASLGRDSRELQLRLRAVAAAVVDQHHPLPARPHTLLGRLQQSLQDDLDVPTDHRPLHDPTDRTLQVHACHGRERQVEVLREVLVGLLAEDPTLEPRDVLVMCPDIEDYAPLISATFGLADDGDENRHPGHRLRVRLADRSLRQTNPLLATVAALLELPDSRVTGSQVLDLAASTPVRRRFEFSDDDLDRLRQWVATSGIRWGLDGEHRTPFDLATVPQNTWRTGLDRILLGAAMAENGLRWIDKTLPLDDVDSSDIDLAGRLAELVDRLAATLDDLTGEHPLTHWLATLGTGMARLTDVTDTDAWQQAQAQRELAAVAKQAGDRAHTILLSLADVRSLLAGRLRGRPTRANFRTGELTMCSMVPMRSVPHRVVCLLGLDDGRFPRTASVDGDDVLARDPHVGERDPRSEDRQLLLDAVLAAKDHLVILYTGADPRTNAERPPAVPVGEILDAVDALVRSPDGRRVREHVVVHHPLQPFDARNFVPGRLSADGRPFSFDRHSLAGAARAARPRLSPGTFLDSPLAPPDEPEELALDDLVAFLEHPAKAFLRQRLGVTLAGDDEELDDALAVELDPLRRWAVGDRLLKARLTGADPMTCIQAEWRRQTLPPGGLGRRVVDGVLAEVEPLVEAAAGYRTGPARTVDVAVQVAGRRLVGTVGGIHDATVVRVEFSRLAPKHRLRAWAQLLALSAAQPGVQWTAVTIGRGRREGIATSRLGPVGEVQAHEHLADLAALRDQGMRAPLPLAVKTSAEYAAKRVTSGATAANAQVLAAQEWTSDRYDAEQSDPAHRLVWGNPAPFEALLAEPADDAGQPVGWLSAEPHRFGALARRLWDPLLAVETLA